MNVPLLQRASARARRERMAAMPFTASLDPGDRERLLEFARTERVRQGTVLFRKGDEPRALVLVMSGIVKISAPAEDGREITLNLIRRGEILGEIALFDGHPRTADASAMTDCELLMLERRHFIPFVQARPKVALKVIELLCARLRHTSEQVEDVAFRYSDGRLARTLMRLAADVLPPAEPGDVRITQRELGNLVGMSRETINKQLRVWQRAGLIAVRKGGVRLLDPDTMALLAGDDAA